MPRRKTPKPPAPPAAPAAIVVPTSQQELREMLQAANVALAVLIAQRIQSGDIGSATWLQNARGFLKDNGINLDSMPARAPADTVPGAAMFQPGVYHGNLPDEVK